MYHTALQKATKTSTPPAAPCSSHLSHPQKTSPERTGNLAVDSMKETPSRGKPSEGFQSPPREAESKQLNSSGSGYASAAGRTGGGVRLSAGQWFAQEERKAIDAYVQDRELEVVVILEGTDTSTGSAVQVTLLA